LKAAKNANIPISIVFQPYIVNANTPPGSPVFQHYISFLIDYFNTEGEELMEHLLKKYGAEGAERFVMPGSELILFY
jgi:hypothetical protein